VISAEQLLDWVEGRNNSSFAGLSFDGGRLRFTLSQAPGARGLEAMVPAVAAGGRLSGLTRDGVPVPTASRVVKGIEYLVFAAAPGAYVATYPSGEATGGGGTAPPVGGTVPPPAGARAEDRLAPRVRVRPRRVRVSRRGLIKLTVTCPGSELRCRIDLRVRRPYATVARTEFELAGGNTRRVSLRLNRGTRRRLSRSGSLRATALATARDGAGNRATTRTHIRLLAPKRR
jgi:hypothetical protein